MPKTEKAPRAGEGHGEFRGLRESLRGLTILVGASVTLIAIAYMSMTALTAPDGWIAKASQQAFAGPLAHSIAFSDD